MVKIGRNEKCPCGSGNKYKKCCLGKKAPNKNERFIITKEIYESDFVPYYGSNEKNVETFFECTVTLPFHLPAPEGITSTISTKDEFYSLRFSSIEIDESSKYLMNVDQEFFIKEISKVSMMVALNKSFQYVIENLEEMLNYCYDESLKKLNEIILSYIALEKDLDCHYLTKEMLPTHSIYRITNLNTWEAQDGLFLVHGDVPFKKPILSPQKMKELGRLQNVVIFEKNPLVNVEAHIVSARRYFKKGFYQEAVIYAQISIDVFIRQLYKVLLKEVEQKTNDDIQTLLETNFMKIIKRELSSFLGGKWDITKPDTEIFNWYNNTYTLRNRVVHAGKIPSYYETESAIQSAIRFRLYVIRLIKTKKNDMPLLNSYFTVKD